MLDLTQHDTNATATLLPPKVKRKGDDQGGLIWDVDVAFPITSADALRRVDAVIRGSAQLIEQGEHGGKHYTLTDNTERAEGRLTITGASDQDDLVHDVKAEVRFTRLRVAGSVATATIRFRIGGAAEQRIGLFE